jgi:acetylornithine deacetylase
VPLGIQDSGAIQDRSYILQEGNSMGVTIDPERTIDLLRQLVQIESVNPSLVPGGNGEAEIAAFVARLLDEAGIEVRLQEAAPGRPNVIGRLRGDGGGRTLIFNAHLDTVTLEGMEDPLSASIEDGRLFGRGAWDTKGGLAAGLSALLALREANVSLAGDLVMACAVDEEYASIGTEALVKELQGDGCVVLEPSDLAVWIAHGGFIWAEIETEGVAAHGSLPDQGVDAIVKMGRVLTELGQLGRRLRRDKAFYSPLAEETMRPSLHASLIEGGREWSSYPDRCLLQLERRIIPTETVEDFEAELEDIISRLADEDPQFKAQWRTTFARNPWQAVEGPLLGALERACSVELGALPRRATGTIWTDAALMQEAGISTVIFGPKGKGKHAVVEYVEVDSVVTCARILARTALDFCNQSGSA